MPESNHLGICFIAPSIYPLFNPQIRAPFDDAEIQLFELAQFFGKDDASDVSVVTGNFGQQDVEYYSGALVYRSDFDVSSTMISRWLKRDNSFTKLLTKIDAQTYFMAGASGLTKEVAAFCKARHKGFVFRVSHQRDCDGTFVHANDKEGSGYRWALRHASDIVCQTEKQKELLRRTENLNAAVIPNLLPLESRYDDDRHDVVWIGDAVEWRQPELFFRLALTLPNHSFTMMIRPRDEAYFERLVVKTRDVPNLGFENSVPYQEWPSFFSKAQLLVNTSRFEGFPFSFSEAFSYGVPVASLNVDPDDILERSHLGFCARGSEVRLAQGVLDLLSYGRQWMVMSDNARSYARKNHDITQQSLAYRKIFIKNTYTAMRKRAKK